MIRAKSSRFLSTYHGFRAFPARERIAIQIGDLSPGDELDVNSASGAIVQRDMRSNLAVRLDKGVAGNIPAFVRSIQLVAPFLFRHGRKPHSITSGQGYQALPQSFTKGVMGTTVLLAWSGETFLLSSAPIWVQPVAMAMSVAQGGEA